MKKRLLNLMKLRAAMMLAALIFSASQSLWAYTIEIDPMMTTSTGTISVDKTSCESGVTVTVTPSPADGYAIGYVKYMGEDYQDIATIEPVDGVYSFTMPDKNVIVSAYFKKLLTNADITIDPIADQTYTGSALMPAVTVRDYEEPINDRCDISYSNNTNAGTATVTIKPKEGESYAGEVTTTFKINPKEVTSPTITLSATSATYNGQDQKPTVTEVKDGNSVIFSTEYTVSYKKGDAEVYECKTPGDYTVVITDVAGGNYIVSGSTTFTIDKKKPVGILGSESLVYNGQPQILYSEATCPDGTKFYFRITDGPENPTDWSEEIPTGTKVGDYRVEWKIEGNEIYKTIQGYNVITIEKAEIKKVELDKMALTLDQYNTKKPVVTKVYAGPNSDIVLPESDYEVSYPQTITETGVYEITVSPKSGNVTGSAKATFKIVGNQDPVGPEPKAIQGLVYNGQPQALITPGLSVGGTWEYALGVNENIENASDWSTAVPTGTDIGRYIVWYRLAGDATHEPGEPTGITVYIESPVKTKENTDGTAEVTGVSDAAKGVLKNGGVIHIPSKTADGQPVTHIADNAFGDAQENVTLVFKNFDPSITFGENSTGGANLETTPEELGNLAKQPNLLETLKKGKILAWLESFPLRSFSSSTNIKIKAEAEYKTTLYAIVDSVCKNQMTNGIVKAALGQDRELNVHIDTKDFLQAFKCNVKENTLSKQYEVSMASLNSTMYSAADKSYVYTANNGILVACDTTGIMTFADGYVDEFVESLNLDAAAKTTIAPYVTTIKNKIKNTIRKHGAKLEAKFNEQTAATGDAQTYAPNMLVPVVEAWSYKNDSQFTYFALTTRNKKNEFVKIADSDTKTPAGKALLKVPTSMVTVSAARSFAISGIEDQDEATAIGAIDRDERATGNDFWYSVSGQRIDQPTAPGIYIRNGKKVIVK